jgi:DNA-binding SARP family transcriptional activator
VLASTVRFVGRVLRGLIAAVVLLALVAGLPWALWHYIGWPLPDHIPTWAELEVVLLGPMTTTFLLNVLACLCWITWAAFTIDVIRCAVNVARDGVDAARSPTFSRGRAAGPVHTLAGILVGAVLLAVLGNRPTPAPGTALTSGPGPALGTGTGIVATAPAWHTPPGGETGELTVQHASAVSASGATLVSAPTPAPTRAESVVVRAPENGVHDSLSRIAQRTLGDGTRWPEIFELNKGKPQPYGHTFTNPSLIFPGEELTLPPDATVSPPPQHPPQNPPQVPAPPPAPPEPPTPPPPTTAPPTSTAPPSSPATPTPSTQDTQDVPPTATDTTPPPATREPGFRWGPELFVGLGLAAAVSAALVVARRRHNSRYRPGSGDRTELPVAPVVYQLRLAHLREETSDREEDTEFELDVLDDDDGDNGNWDADLDDDLDDGDPRSFDGTHYSGESEHSQRVSPRVPRRVPRLPALVVGAPETRSGTRPALAPGLGVRDGREIALDLATARGLGLVGAGAPAAARALLVAALTAFPTAPHGRPAAPIPTQARTQAPAAGASVVVPADDLTGLLGRTAAHTALPTSLPTSLRVVRDLDEALDVLEAETLVRATAGREQNSEQKRAEHPWPTLVLVTRPPEHGRQRLQAVLDNGAPFGITGLLLGQWQPGVTCYVRADGTISATSPGPGEPLRGIQVFRLGDNDTTELLTLLQQAEPTTQRDTPGDTPADLDAGTDADTEVPPPPPHNDDNDGDGDGDLAGNLELEVTASVRASDPIDTELEILGSRRAAAPGARLRPPVAPHQQSVTRRRAEDTANDTAKDTVETTEIPHRIPVDIPVDVPVDGNHEVGTDADTDDGGEVGGDEPAPTGEHGTIAATSSPHATPVGVPAPTPDTAPEPMSVPITIAVLGPLRVHWNPDPRNHTATDSDRQGREITGVLQPRTRELLVLLALHPEGITREALVSTLWGEDPPARPTNALHTSLSRLRHALAAATDQAVTDIAVVGNGRYQLDPATVTVDYWRFAHAVAARRAAATEHERVDAYRQVINSYRGPLAEGMTTEWIDPAREAIRRDAIDAVAALARSLVETDPQQTLDLLEVARAFDPHNELLYRDIMRLQDRLGQHDAIPRTLTLLTTRLAELNEAPSPQARGLATRLSQRRDGTPDTTPGDTAGGPPAPAARVASKDDPSKDDHGRRRSAAS